MDTKDTALKVVSKYLKKGNMPMCLRDILPSSGLSLVERESVAELAHDVVRYKRLYDKLFEETGITKSPQAYVDIVLKGVKKDLHFDSVEIKYSCSTFVADLFKDNLEWLEYLNQRPPTALCVNFNKSNTKEVFKILKSENMPAEQSNLETTLLTSSIGRYCSAIKNGLAHVQDESSQLVSLITSGLGDNILDFCAGNGGKALAIASITKNKKNLHAFDLNPKKRETLKERANKYDAAINLDEKLANNYFDVILVDAPCTGIGAARRNPEAKYVQGPGAFPEMQLDILDEAEKKLKPGGKLIYTVCTSTPQETSEVVRTFQKEKGFKMPNIKNLPHADFIKKTEGGAFIAVPKGDLFFISILSKEK